MLMYACILFSLFETKECVVLFVDSIRAVILVARADNRGQTTDGTQNDAPWGS